MSFGAMASWQAWGLLALAAGAATWLFLLKVRPPRILVPSLTLWRRVLDEARELTWWERVRRAVSLAIVIVTTLALVLAIVRPSASQASRSGPAAAGASTTTAGGVLIVVDSSWSMLARTTRGGTRWNRAVSQARALTASASGDEVALATTADGLVEGPTSDLSLIEAALDRITPSGGEVSAWPRIAGARAVHFFTDGAVGRRLDPEVQVHSVFEEASNVAITAFDVRASETADLAGRAYLELANYAATPQKVHLVIKRGEASVFDDRVDVGAGQAIRQVLPLPRAGDARLRASVEAPENALAVDDDAVAWIAGAQPLAVTVVTDQPAPFKSLLERDPAVRLTLVSPSAYRPATEDVVIFDRWLPAEAPSRPALSIAPPASSWLGPKAAVEEALPRWAIAGSHPVLQGVDVLTLAIHRARAHDGPGLVPIAQSEKGTPLVYVAESPERRLIVLTFGVGDSNLAAVPVFPILVGNAIEWLGRPDAGRVRRPGAVSLPMGVSRVIAPDNKAVPLTRVGDAAVAMLRTTGFYTVESGGARSVMAVNAGDPETSNLARTNLAESARASATTPNQAGRPWWLYCAALAFALLVGEWWTWQRRITV